MQRKTRSGDFGFWGLDKSNLRYGIVCLWLGWLLALSAFFFACSDEISSNDFVTDEDLEADGNEESLENFEEYAWLVSAPDYQNEFCCPDAENPEAAEERVFIECRMEGESFITDPAEAKDEIVVVAYNLERGRHADEIIEQLSQNGSVPYPDILLVSEADRNCNRSSNRYITRYLAEALGMNYVYAVEFVELPDSLGTGIERADCEHGNGILSRYPLGNVRQIRHATQRNWSESTDEPRLGGRIAVAADVQIGQRIVHVYSVHFESDAGEQHRGPQAVETAEDALTQGGLSLIGGDFNAGMVMLDQQLGVQQDQTLKAFLDRGFFDAHASIPYEDRTTTSHDVSLILDYIVASRNVVVNAGIGDAQEYGSLSDHLPVWVRIDLSGVDAK